MSENTPYGRYTSREVGVVKQVLHALERRRHPVLFDRAIWVVAGSMGKIYLQEVEDLLREERSSTYLVAAALSELRILHPEIADPKNRLKAVLPHTGDVEYPYYLHTCVNGGTEAAAVLSSLRLDAERNRSRLARTGILRPRSLELEAKLAEQQEHPEYIRRN